MLSRVGENLYWMARNVERAENTARLVNVNGNLLLDLPRYIQFGWAPLIDITGTEDLFNEFYERADESSVVMFLVGDSRNTSSILSALRHARENIRTARDIVPRECGEQINDLYLYVHNNLNSGIARNGRYKFLKNVILGCQQIVGILSGTMAHDHGYQFMRLGRSLERADMTTRIVDVRSENLLVSRGGDLTPFENIQWMSVLKSVSGYQMYRRIVRTRIRGTDVLKFLLQNREFPRAFYHCVLTVEDCLSRLPRNDKAVRAVTRLQRISREADVYELARTPKELRVFMDHLQVGLSGVHGQVTNTYFSDQEAIA